MKLLRCKGLTKVLEQNGKKKDIKAVAEAEVLSLGEPQLGIQTLIGMATRSRYLT